MYAHEESQSGQASMPATQASGAGAIPDALTRHRQALDEIAKLSAELRSRLAPVLGPNLPVGISSVPPKHPEPSLRERLDETTRQAIAIGEGLREILTRLEL